MDTTPTLLSECPFPLDEAGEHFFRPVCKQTAYNWASKGLSGVLLETISIGAKRYTSKAALDRFIAAVTRARAPRQLQHS